MKSTPLLTTLLSQLLALGMLGCAPAPIRQDTGHVKKPEMNTQNIPAPVAAAPLLEAPRPSEPLETYSVVVTDVPLKEMLFALARDAKLNIDIHPGVTGQVTLNAIDQTLPQILERIARQADVRFKRMGDQLEVQPDLPFLRTYKIDYLNLARDNTAEVNVATQIATTGASAVGGSSGGGNNNSTTQVSSVSRHRFWETLRNTIRSMVEDGNTTEADSTQTAENSEDSSSTESSEDSGEDSGSSTGTSVMIAPESGLLTVRATERQHGEIQAYLDQLLPSAQRQVLIEATIVEVTLNDTYQLGVDWSVIADGAGWSVNQALVGTNLNTEPFTTLTYADRETRRGNISNTVSMLREFGDVKVLSSPKIMAINNQAALLKVVDNLVYFTIDAETSTEDGVILATFSSEVHTVPVGFVMSVTPQISAEDTVLLNVRPTISRVTGFVNDPNPALAQEDVESRIPQIQVREMDSILRVQSGQTAVLGGLIQDSVDLNKSGTPFLSELPRIGDLFSYRDNRIRRSELVIFLRPRVIRNASIGSEFQEFQHYLNQKSEHGGDPRRLTQPIRIPAAESRQQSTGG